MSAVSTPPSEPPENGADRRASLAAVVMVVALLVAGELFACHARSFQKVPSVIPGRMANVVGFADKLVLVPPSPKPARPALLLLGSSQSYASSSPEPNANGLGDQAGTLIDRLAEEVALPQATYLRFASGSILPNEMMIAEAYVEAMGYRPAVVVLPLIWTNIAIDRDYRPTFREALESAPVAATVARRLRENHAPAGVIDSFDEEARRSASKTSFDGPRPIGDVIDDRLTAWTQSRIGLVGRREDIQAGLQERVVHQVVGRLAPTTIATRSPREETLRFNLEFLHAFIRSLRHDGISVIVYRAPQRTDIPVPVDVRHSDEALVPFLKRLEDLGATIVDARPAVPDTMFGWSGPSKDFNHYLRDGHRAVAHAIVEAGREHGAFDGLKE